MGTVTAQSASLFSLFSPWHSAPRRAKGQNFTMMRANLLVFQTDVKVLGMAPMDSFLIHTKKIFELASLDH